MRRFIVYDIYSQTVQLLQISKVRTDDCVMVILWKPDLLGNILILIYFWRILVG